MSYASASIYAEPISTTVSGYNYQIRCALRWGYGGGQYGTAKTYMRYPREDWKEIHAKPLIGQDYLEWAIWHTFGLERNGQIIYVQMGVEGVIGSNQSAIYVGAGLAPTPSPVVPLPLPPEPVIPEPPPYVPPYVPPEEPVTPPFVPSCVMTAIGAPLLLLGFLRTQVRPRMPAWFVRVYYRVNYHILSIFF